MMVTVVQTAQRGSLHPQSVSMISVVMTSRREKADVRPRRKSVKTARGGVSMRIRRKILRQDLQKTTEKKGAPGIWARASGYVMKPVTKVPRASPDEGSMSRKPMTPKTEKAAMISTAELLKPTIRASCTALECCEQ